MNYFERRSRLCNLVGQQLCQYSDGYLLALLYAEIYVDEEICSVISSGLLYCDSLIFPSFSLSRKPGHQLQLSYGQLLVVAGGLESGESFIIVDHGTSRPCLVLCFPLASRIATARQ